MIKYDHASEICEKKKALQLLKIVSEMRTLEKITLLPR